MRITHKFLVAVLLLPLVVLTVVSAIMLWPSHHKYAAAANLGANVQLVNGTAVTVINGPCAGDPSDNVCQTATVLVTSGPDKGHDITLMNQQGPGQAVLHNKDKIVLGRAPGANGAPATYYFSDFQRKVPLLAFALVFAGLVALIARWRGIGALAGLVFTFFVVTYFILPSVLGGHSPVAVALTGSAAIVIVVIYIAHGFNARSTIALVGTLLSLLLTGLLSWLGVRLTHLTGLSSDEATYVQNFAGQVNLQGLVLGGIIIGSLGVLNDMTVTQSSAVWEIHVAQPARARIEVYRSALRVGRDHIASTVYTLVLAYTGAALPLLILFTIASRKFTDVIGTDVVAEEIVRALMGSIGLILSVPLTTALAAATLNRAAPEEIVVIDEDAPAEDVSAYVDAHAEALSQLEEVEAEKRSAHVATITDPTSAQEDVAEGADSATAIEPIVLQPPKRKKGIFRRKEPEFKRKMSRRERKFWENE